MTPDSLVPPKSRPRVAPGTRLNGIYEIDRLIATGGMGEIYRGHVIETGDAVAIKMIRPDLAENEAALALFRKEASALHNLHHEAIVRYYVFTTDPVLGCPYLAMEFVDGQSLADLLRRGPLDFDAVRMLQQRLAAGLEAAHELGIVHRDVSPDNIILPAGNVARAKIIDFGIARSSLIGDGTVIGSGFAGKLNYVSPEQLGLFGGDVTAKSDIYSLGLVLAEALSGRPLDMGGSQVQVVEKRRRVPDLSIIDRRMRPLLEHMLQPRPEDRPASMAAVAAWRSAPSKSSPGRGPKRRLRFALAGLVGAAALGGAAVLVGPQLFPGLVPGAGPPPPQEDFPDLTPAPPPNPPVPGPGAALPARVPPDARTDLPPGDMPPREERPAAPLSPAERITQYITGYQGGDCFFLTPVAVSETAASVEAYGVSAAPFEAFDKAFRRDHGFEAAIGLRQVTLAQCPVVTFLDRLGAHRGPAPRLEIGAFNLRSGQTLTGTVDRYGDRHVDVLLVSDNGYVHDLSSFTTRGPDAIKFNLRIEGSGGAPPKPQILLAIASPRPLAALASGTPMTADRLFPLLLDEAAKAGQTIGVAVKYFKLDG